MNGVDPTKFHAHLDVCRRCREQPFNLCPTGACLLKEAVPPDAEARLRTAHPPIKGSE